MQHNQYIKEQTATTSRLVSTLAVACPVEELTFLLEIASFWKFSAKGETVMIERMMVKWMTITLYRSGEEGDWGELAVALLVEAGDLDHVLRAGPQLFQTGPAVPLA